MRHKTNTKINKVDRPIVPPNKMAGKCLKGIEAGGRKDGELGLYS